MGPSAAHGAEQAIRDAVGEVPGPWASDRDHQRPGCQEQPGVERVLPQPVSIGVLSPRSDADAQAERYAGFLAEMAGEGRRGNQTTDPPEGWNDWSQALTRRWPNTAPWVRATTPPSPKRGFDQ